MSINPTQQHLAYTQSLWKRLQQVRFVRFVSSSPLPGYDGIATGLVSAQMAESGALTFEESGTWRSVDGMESDFKNIFRWIMRPNGVLSLEHLRYGPSNPVHLLDLQPISATEWQPVEPFLCEQDGYTLRIKLEETAIYVYWRITGPKKDEYLEYTYQSNEIQANDE